MAAVAGGWVDRGMAQVAPDQDSAWVAEEWVEVAARGRVVVPVGARASAAQAVACGIRAEAEVELEESAAEAAPAKEVGPGVEPAVQVIPVGLAAGAVVDLVVEADLVAVVVAPAELAELAVGLAAEGPESVEELEFQVGKARHLENGGRRRPCCTLAEPEGQAV